MAEHSPERARVEVEFERDWHLSTLNLAWFVSMMNGTAGFQMDPAMQESIDRYLPSCRDCQEKDDWLRQSRVKVTRIEILTGHLR